MTVLDASALLAVLNDERGADAVQSKLDGSTIGAANLAEVVGKLVDADIDTDPLLGLLSVAGVSVEPLTADDAVLAGALRTLRGGRSLSLGDRCCLALGLRVEGEEVLTSDRAWTRLDLPLTITVVR